ncbi:hypothetical protein FHS83_000537 [Rhizomicrobium palustre]|uniref:Uncharacterized protein n=1 Tax=Rhizomicrobium palustre TaxID=189966 RepID=A0A846MVH7_9PROT|nr:hypothetical protein [Rhizomicrobium palustre]NIK87219.1 hypothetical protein [Rhizomicrobium palustre]
MGAARLLAKGWVLVCFFAGAHALRQALLSGGNLQIVLPQVLIAVSLFAAMGLLFVGGYGASSDGFHHHTATIKEKKLAVALPGFDDVVLFVFAALIFATQVWLAPAHLAGEFGEGLARAIAYVVPGQAVIAGRIGTCGPEEGRILASAVSWLLAMIFAASAVSRLRQAAEAIRLDRALHPHGLSLTALAATLGVVAILGIQCLFVGSVLALLPCAAFTGISGGLLIGLGPLLLGYIVYASLANLLASGSGSKE